MILYLPEQYTVLLNFDHAWKKKQKNTAISH